MQHPERLVTLKTCDESDEDTCPDQQKDKDKDNDNDKDKDMTKTFRKHPQRVILETYDL